MDERQYNFGISEREMMEAGVQFGHLRSKWDPQMAPYIYMEKNGVHLLDLRKSALKLEVAAHNLQNIAALGRKVMFVATKKQAKEVVAETAKSIGMPFVTERWLGGMLTNFTTVRKSIKRMSNIDKMVADGTILNMAKRERLMVSREREKLERLLGGIADLGRLPSALFIVDTKKEHIAVAEATKLGIPSFGIVDTNCNPNIIDFPIPGNDDNTKSISYICNVVARAIQEGLSERNKNKEMMKEDEKEERIAE